jgi:16S rRNA (guanine527-N7)-methyltransferase
MIGRGDDSPAAGMASGQAADLFSVATAPALEAAIGDRARACGIELSDEAVEFLALHARCVRERNTELSLTSIIDPAEFLERHLGESFEGAALLDADVEGVMLDLGSGNGYPGLPVAVARPGLTPFLVEASMRKAAFLRVLVEEAQLDSEVVERQVQRAADLEGVGPIHVLVTRAAGAWDRILPRLAPSMAPEGTLLVWAGDHMKVVKDREAWSRYHLAERKPLPGRDRSWIWRFNLA